VKTHGEDLQPSPCWEKKSLDLPKTDFAPILEGGDRYVFVFAFHTPSLCDLIIEIQWSECVCRQSRKKVNKDKKANAPFQASVILIGKAVWTYMPCVVRFSRTGGFHRSFVVRNSAIRCVSLLERIAVASWFIVKINVLVVINQTRGFSPRKSLISWSGCPNKEKINSSCWAEVWFAREWHVVGRKRIRGIVEREIVMVKTVVVIDMRPDLVYDSHKHRHTFGASKTSSRSTIKKQSADQALPPALAKWVEHEGG